MKTIRGTVALIALAQILAVQVTNGAPPTTQVQVVNTQDDPVPVNVQNDSPGAVRGARQAFGFDGQPAAGQSVEIVSLEGPGVFISARMTVFGDADLTEAALVLDGESVISGNPAALQNIGLTEMNPYGIAVFSTGTGLNPRYTIVIGFPFPLAFEETLE